MGEAALRDVLADHASGESDAAFMLQYADAVAADTMVLFDEVFEIIDGPPPGKIAARCWSLSAGVSLIGWDRLDLGTAMCLTA